MFKKKIIILLQWYGEQVPVFIAEITPKNLRGGLTTVNQVRELQYIDHVNDQHEIIGGVIW